jgi:hypothetical protein
MSRFCLTISFMVCCLSPAVGDDVLNTARSEVRSPSEPATPTSEKSSRSTDPCDDGLDGELLGFCGQLFAYVIASPFYVPPMLFGDHYDTPGTFVAYPYAVGWGGSMQPGLEVNRVEGATPFEWERRFTFRASVEEGNNFDGLNRVGLTFLADSFTRFGIGGGVHFYEEKRTTQSPDQLAIGDVNLLFRFAQSERVQFRTGLGARFLNDDVRTDWGWNFVYGAEAYPFEPLSWSWQLETGTLGNAWVFRATTRLGFVWKNSEAYVGYDYLRIGHAELQGPMVGLRVWF